MMKPRIALAAIAIALAACDSKPPATPVADTQTGATPAAPQSNPVKAPIDRTRSVIEQVRQQRTGEEP